MFTLRTLLVVEMVSSVQGLDYAKCCQVFRQLADRQDIWLHEKRCFFAILPKWINTLLYELTKRHPRYFVPITFRHLREQAFLWQVKFLQTRIVSSK